MNQVENREIIY